MIAQQSGYSNINYESGNISTSSSNIGSAIAGVSSGSNKLGGLMLQSILSSLGEEGGKYVLHDVEGGVEVTPTDQRISKNTPFVNPPYSSIPAVDLIQQHAGVFSTTSPTQQYLLGDSISSSSSGSGSMMMKKMEVNTLVLGGIITSRNKYSDRGQVLLVEIYEEHYVSHCIYQAALEKGVIDQLMNSKGTWRLITGFQCSFVGQFMKFIEQLGVLNANITINDNGSQTNFNNNNSGNGNSRNSKTGPSSTSQQQQQQQQQHSQGGNAGAWEQLLRSSVENLSILWTSKTLKACDRYVPFAIRASKEKEQQGVDTSKSQQKCISSRNHLHPPHLSSSSIIPDQSRFFQLLDIAEHHPEVISEWTLFSFYIEDALSQVLSMMMMMMIFMIKMMIIMMILMIMMLEMMIMMGTMMLMILKLLLLMMMMTKMKMI